MLTITLTKAANPNLTWAARQPGLAAILAQALRRLPRKPDARPEKARAPKL